MLAWAQSVVFEMTIRMRRLSGIIQRGLSLVFPVVKTAELAVWAWFCARLTIWHVRVVTEQQCDLTSKSKIMNMMELDVAQQ